jgi:hypothetical protein
MDILQKIHLVFSLSSLLICYFAYPSFKRNQSFKLLAILLTLSVANELIIIILRYFYEYGAMDYKILHHLYMLAEIVLLAFFFYLNSFRRYTIILLSFSISICILYIIFMPKTKIGLWFPPKNFINFSNILLVIWSLIALFSVRPHLTTSFIMLPIFWICIGVLVFNIGIFYFNNIYNTLSSQNYDPKYFDLLNNIQHLSIRWLYNFRNICFSIAFLCSIRIKNKIFIP